MFKRHWNIYLKTLLILVMLCTQFMVIEDSDADIISDDFSADSINYDVWTFINPMNDADVSVNGTQALISIPATGDVHDVWTNGNTLPRIVQYVNNTDFQVEAKFESSLDEGFKSQGILIEQEDSHVLRLEFHKLENGIFNFFAATIWGSSYQIHAQDAIVQGAAMYLRVSRQADLWTVSYSDDGETWNTGATLRRK